MRAHQAFSLIEILVVVVVIGILAATVTPKFLQAKEEAAIAATSQDLSAIVNALSMYYAATGSYPRDVVRMRVVKDLSPYFKSDNPFAKPAPIGGVYDYEGPPNWDPMQISIRKNGSQVYTDAIAQKLDEYMDNGDLRTGKIRKHGSRLGYYFNGQ
ncbi:MAG: type II secretion system protein [Phycisphaerales bacterium]